MKLIKKYWPFLAIGLVVLLFFFPIFKGLIPFPGDLLVSQAPYKAESFLGFPAGGYPNKAQGPDVIYEIYPWRYFSVDQLKQGQIPFWNPHNFSGNPQMANFQTAVFYPLNVLYLTLPFNTAWSLIILLQPFLAAIFMYAFLKKGIGLSDFACVLGGLGFGFSSYMTVWLEYGNIGHTLLWLPLLLLFVKNYFNKPTVKNYLGIVLGLTLSILAGYIQGVFYIYAVICFYYLFLLANKKQEFKNYKKNLLFILALFTPFLITCFQLLPTLKLFSQSTRGAYTLLQIEKNLISPLYWLTGFFPDFFGNPATRNYWLNGTYIERVLYPGGIFIFFAIMTIANKINILEKKFFILLSAFSLLIATNLPFVKYFYLIPIPVISTTVASRELSIFIFGIVILGAIGIDFLLNKVSFNKKSIVLYILFFGLVWGFVLIFLKTNPNFADNLKITLRNLILPTGLLGLLLLAVFVKKINKKLSMIILTAVLIIDLLYFFNKITPFSPTSLAYPNTDIVSKLKQAAGINRVWGYGSSYIPSNFQSVDGLYSPEGNDPLHIARYTQLLESSKDGKYPKSLPRPDANIAPGYGPDDLKSNFYRKRILDLLGVKYIIHEQNLKDAWESADTNTFPSDSYSLFGKIYPFQIYENKTALPRIFITGDYILAKEKKEALSLVYDKKINLGKTLILEKNPAIKIDKNSTGSAILLSYTPNKIIIKTKTSENALLFISDNYYNDWQVFVDGKKSEILLADYSFRAVAVEKGEHTVVFSIFSKDYILGLWVLGFGIIVLLISLYYVKKSK